MQKLEATYFKINTLKDQVENDASEKALLQIFKLLSPQHLLLRELENDSNFLNEAFL